MTPATTTSTSRTTRPRTSLEGVAVIRARATQNLSSFNLDFVGMTIRSLKVDGRTASWSRDGGELTVTPKHGRTSGQQLDDLFQTWLFTPAKPAGIEPQAAAKRGASRINAQARLRKAVKR